MSKAICTKCGQSFDEQHQSNWGPFTCSYHPRSAQNIGTTGPRGDYAELWYFPCCGKGVTGEIRNGSDVQPARSPGCQYGFHSGTRPRIFLSYAHSDGRFGQYLENELKRRGYAVWKDTTELLPGKDWQQVINEAMDESTHFIVLLSPRSIERPEVNRELGAAFHARKPIIPIVLETCAIPPQLQGMNYLDWRENQDYGDNANFNLLDDALGDPVRLLLLKQIREG